MPTGVSSNFLPVSQERSITSMYKFVLHNRFRQGIQNSVKMCKAVEGSVLFHPQASLRGSSMAQSTSKKSEPSGRDRSETFWYTQ